MKIQKPSKAHRKYDDEFKRNALQMIQQGQSVRSVSEALGVGESQLHKWKRQFKQAHSSDDMEVSELRARLRQVETERDILKNVWLRRRGQAQNGSCWRKAGRMQQMYPASLW